MTVHEVEAHIIEFYPQLRRKLLDGTYKPQPVRRVEIPKPNGGIRKLGLNFIKSPGRVCLLKILNRRVRNRTHGGVRGRSLKAPPTRLFSIRDQ
ncbi:hypothetical protein SAMN05216375_11855 [Trichococcus ilyis]|uniref:Uncharacterized protein n=1 Tax=Trichococcus ilyis TaxID=640938 RepID=A0A1H7A121_9LACT|nr:hypothetical protein SAMN05216375_11855 [Trichococcus ilyis]